MSGAEDAASPTTQGDASTKVTQEVTTELTKSVKANAEGIQAQAVETLKTEALSMTAEARAKLLDEQQRLKNEVQALKTELKAQQQQATTEVKNALSALRWLLELSPNIDGSLAFQIGSEFAYLKHLLIGLKYVQIQRTEREDCDEFATSSCKAYTDVDDHVITLKAFGYEIPIGQSFRVTLNLNGIYLNQLTEGTSVDTGLDRYVETQGGFTSLQVNTQIEIDWRITEHSIFHLEGSLSPYHRSVEKESGFDSGLLARTSMNGDRIGNDNNRVYSGELGTYTKYFDNNESTYFDGAMNLYMRNLMGESDMDIGLNARFLSYGADANRTVVYNGELKALQTSRYFEKIDIISKVAFELSFLGFSPSNPMLGLTYTWSKFDGFRDTITNQSVGFAFSFATPPE